MFDSYVNLPEGIHGYTQIGNLTGEQDEFTSKFSGAAQIPPRKEFAAYFFTSAKVGDHVGKLIS